MGIEQINLIDQLSSRLHKKELQPELTAVWTRFFQMIKIRYPQTLTYPHGDASQMIEYFREYASSNKFKFEVDNCQNVCIGVVASLGHENDREIVVQGHHDAVFVGDPDPSLYGVNPELTEDGKWIKGDGTNLIADNRLGVAGGLTAVERVVRSGKAHGPFEILLTAGEDSGLIGATHLGKTKSKFLNGNQTIINVDSSEGPEWITIGCASGSRDNLIIPIKHEAIGIKKLVKYDFSGFPGGHSGLDIGKDRPSSIKFFAELFSILKQNFPDIGLVSIKAGKAFNAIPAGASFVLAVEVQDEQKIQGFIDDHIIKMKSQIPTDATEEYKNARVNISAKKQPLSEEEFQIKQQLDQKTTNFLINTLLELPHGVGQRDGEGILSSNNIGTVEIEQDQIIIQTMTRGRETSYRDKLREKIRQIAQRHSLSPEEKLAYRHWSPRPDRKIVLLAKKLGKRLLGKEMKTRVSLGGLEPGIFEGDFPGLEAISISIARIIDEHSLGEQAEVDSLGEGYLLLKTLLTEIPKAYR